MAHQPADSEGGSDSRSEWSRIKEIGDFDEFFEAAEAYFREKSIRRYGKEIFTLSEDDEGLMASIKSGDPERQMMALTALELLRYVYHPQIAEACIEYIESGSNLGVREGCLGYLRITATEKHDDRIIGVLENCASRLKSCGKSQDDEVICALINLYLESHRRSIENNAEPGSGSS